MVKHNYRTCDRALSFMEIPNSHMRILLVYCLLAFGLQAEGATATGAESKSAYACEDDQLVLKCQVGEVIRILRANYGRFTISLCNRHGQTEGWNLQCMSPKAKDIISERCDGRRECDMRVGNHIFVDPCPSTTKYAEVKYTCHLAPIETPYIQTTSTEVIQIQPQMPLNGSPRPPQITSVTALGPHQIEVMWTQAEPPNPIITTAIYLKDIAMKTEPSPIYTDSENSLIVDELRPNTSYSIYLKSFNIHGPSLTSNTVSVTTSPLDQSYMKSTTVRTDTANTGIFTAETEQSLIAMRRLHPHTNLDNKMTTATPDQSTILKPDPTPSDDYFPNVDPQSNDYSSNVDSQSNDYSSNVDPSSNDYTPNDPGVPVAKEVDNDEYVNGVVDKFCVETVHRGVMWPQTRFGRIMENICPEHLRGAATWRCLDYGWEKTGPDLSDCTSAWMEKMDSQINKVMQGVEPADLAAVALNDALAGQEFTSGDLKKAAIKLLPKLTKGLQKDDPTLSRPNKIDRMKQFKKAFMSTSSNLLSKKNMKSWRSLSRQDRRRAATSFVLAIEDVGFHTASLMDIGTSEVTVDENIVMKVTVMDTQQTHDDITFPSKEDLEKTSWESGASSDSITIRSTSLKVAGMKGPINIVFTLYKNMEDLIQPQLNTITSVTTLSSSSDADGYHSAGTVGDSSSIEGSGSSAVRVINSKIIAASINSTKPKRKLTEPVWFTLVHLEPTNTGKKPLCSFWDVDTSYLSGQWSQDGCRLLDTNTTHTTCECDHLTNFAILMDITGVELTAENKLALRVITFVGCVISVICLTLSWITFLVFRNLQCDRNTIHRNLVLCLLLAEIVFLGGISQTETKILCSIIAGILHYLFLGAFAWMCLEGVQLYIMLVEVFEQEKSRVLWYYLFGYGVPAVVVITSAAVYHEGYGTVQHCWLTTDKYFILSFVGPALAVMLINIGMLSIAIYTMCRHSIMSITLRERSKATKFSVMDSLSAHSMKTFASPKVRFPDLQSWVKGAVVLVVLLGLTWLLGVLYLNEESVIIAYFFTVLNSLQGLFIFVFHCLKNEKVQKEYRKVVRRTSWLPDCIRVNYGGYTGMASGSQIGSSDSRNYLSKPFSQKQTGQSTLSTSSSAKPFLSKDQHRRDDTDNFTSKESSNIPSSLNGYVYNPSYSINGNGSAKAPFLGTGHGEVTKLEESRHAVGDNSYDVVDDRAVSEYCKHNMQVQREEFRYSVASDENYEEKHIIPVNSLHMDNQFLASDSRKPPFGMSSDRFTVVQDKDREKMQREEPMVLNLHQYVIPASKQISDSQEVMRNISGKSQRADNSSRSTNSISNPHSSHSVTSQQDSNSPDLPFRQDYTEPTLTSSATNSPESDYMIPTSCEPEYEEVKVNLNSQTSSNSSLTSPN